MKVSAGGRGTAGRYLPFLVGLAALSGAVAGSGDPRAAGALALLLGSGLVIAAYCRSIGDVCLILWVALVVHRKGQIPRDPAIDVVQAAFRDSAILLEMGLTLFVFLGAFVAWLIRLRIPRPLTVEPALRWLLLYAAYAGVTLSFTPNAANALFWCLRLLAAALILTLFFERADRRAAIRFVNVTLLAVAPYVLLPIFAYLQGSISWDGRITGFWFHTNMASIVSFAVALVLLTRGFRDPDAGLGTFALGLAALVAGFIAGSKTAAVAAVAAMLAVSVIGWRHWSRDRLIGAGFAVPVVFWFLVSGLEGGLFQHWDYYRDTMRFGTVIDRVDLWHGAIARWREAPIVGHGYASSEVARFTQSMGRWVTSHAHNSLFQALVDTGLIGTTLLVLVPLSVLARVARSFRFLARSEALDAFAGVVVLTLVGVMEAVIGGPVNTMSFLFLGLLIALGRILEIEREDAAGGWATRGEHARPVAATGAAASLDGWDEQAMRRIHG